MQEIKNPIICDPTSGICEIPSTNNQTKENIEFDSNADKPLKLIYFTDPICSACWGIEPQLRKLKLEYGATIEFEYHMGGLLPNWSYNAGGINKPSDVAHHWDEVSAYYDMPIDGNIWHKDPLSSSYPPSIAFKAAEMQNPELAISFLREIREMVFLQKKNIAKWENLEMAAENVGLDLERFRSDYEGKASALFEQDLQYAKELGVRGFPTIILSKDEKKEIIYGFKPYSSFEKALQNLIPNVSKYNYDKSWEFIFSIYHSLTAREFAELMEFSKKESVELLDNLTGRGLLKKYNTRNGAIWYLAD